METNKERLGFFLRGVAEAKGAASRVQVDVPSTLVPETYLSWAIRSDPGPVDSNDNMAPEDRLAEARISLFRLLVLIANSTVTPPAGEATSPRTYDQWKTWIATAAGLVFSDPFSEGAVSEGVSLVDSKVATKLVALLRDHEEHARCGAAREAVPAWAGTQQQLLGTYISIAETLSLPPIGAVTAPALLALADAGTEYQRAAYYGLVVLLCGRPLVAHTAAISTRRPDNLQQKFNNKQAWVEIGGPLKPSEAAWRRIGATWEIDPRFRYALVLPLLGLVGARVGIVGSIVATMVKMTELAQMAHVGVIGDFLAEYPWVVDMPEFSAEVLVLSLDTARWMAYPGQIRAFIKMLDRDMCSLFDSKRLARLTRLAVDVTKTSKKGLGDYAVQHADNTLRARFDQLLREKTPQVAAPVQPNLQSFTASIPTVA